jgi:hypothetical protein
VFIDRDPTVLDRLFSDDYQQHNPQIPNGTAAIKALLGRLPADFEYEPGLILADGDCVAIHGRYLGWGPKPMVAVDTVLPTARSPGIEMSCRRRCPRRRAPTATACSRVSKRRCQHRLFVWDVSAAAGVTFGGARNRCGEWSEPNEPTHHKNNRRNHTGRDGGRRRAIEGGSYRVVVSLTRVVLRLLSLGIFDKAYAKATAGSTDEHTYIAPDLFTAETPLGSYQGMTDQIVMSRTPGSFRTVLVPRGSSKPQGRRSRKRACWSHDKQHEQR